VDHLIFIVTVWAILVLDFVGLVGAFSDFGRADTGKPVQIYCIFLDFGVFPKF